METRASHVAVGTFVLLLLLGLTGFVVWISKFQQAADLKRYDILFEEAVTGLELDSNVRYRGVPVGRVQDIRIDPANIERIRVTIEVRGDTPVKVDTKASLELQGLTGGSLRPAERRHAGRGAICRAPRRRPIPKSARGDRAWRRSSRARRS